MILPVQKPDFTVPTLGLYSLAGNQPGFVSEGLYPGTKFTERESYPAQDTHPWKVTAGADVLLKVNGGRMWSYRNMNDPEIVTEPLNLTAFAIVVEEAEVTATAAVGWIYLLSNLTLVKVFYDLLGSTEFFSYREAYSTPTAIVYSTDAPDVFAPQTADPAKNFALPIAKVLLDGGVATVDVQYARDDIWPLGGSYTLALPP